jgi:hypothetical protein
MRLAAATAVLVLATTGLSACDAVSKDDGPDPDEAAAALATALAYGTFADVDFAGTTAQDVTADYAAVVEGMGDVTPTVSAGEVDEAEDADGTATTTLTWTWPVGGKEWTYTTKAELTEAGDAWQVGWSRELVEPSLDADTVLDVTPIAGRRGPIVGAGGVRLVTDRPVVRFGIDRSQVPAARATDSARRLAQLVGVDPAPYAKQVGAAGEKAFVEAIVLRKDDVPLDVAQGYRAIKGAIAIADELPLAPTREFAAPILGTVGEVTAEMIEDDPDKYQLGDRAGLSGLQARYDDQLQGRDGVVVNAVASDGDGRDRVRRCGSRWTSGSSRSPSSSWPRSGRAARWSRSGRRPGRSSRRPTVRATTATTSPPMVRWRRDRRSRASAASPCCAPG